MYRSLAGYVSLAEITVYSTCPLQEAFFGHNFMEEAKEAAERAQAAAASEASTSKRAGKKKGTKSKKGFAQETAAAEPSAHKPSTSAAADAELGSGEERLEGELELAGEGYGAVAASAVASTGVTISAPADLFAELARLVKAQAPPPAPAANAATTVKQEVKTPAAHVHQPPMMGDLLGALVPDRTGHMSRLMGVSALAGAIAAPLAVTTAEHGVAGQLIQPISAQMRSPTGASRSAQGSAAVVLRSPNLPSASALHSLHAASSASVHASGGGASAAAVGESAPVDDGMFHELKDLLPNVLLSTELKDLHILPHEADSIFDLGFDTLGIEEPRGSLLCTCNAHHCTILCTIH